jgi:hypothetical protein
MRTLVADLRLEGRIVGIGVDRLDYTKGIPERLAAIDRLLQERPDLADRFTFVQIGVPSRADVPGYAEITVEIAEHVARVNAKHGRGPDDGPIRYVQQSFPLPTLVALYRLAHFCIVSSLHDGMNLVAKEFVAARDDLDGVLILSELAGADHQPVRRTGIHRGDRARHRDACVGTAAAHAGVAPAGGRARRAGLGLGHPRSARNKERTGVPRWVDATKPPALRSIVLRRSPRRCSDAGMDVTCFC